MWYWKKLINDKSWKAEKWVFIALLTGVLITGAVHFFSQKSIFQFLDTTELLKRQYFIATKLRVMENHLLGMEGNMQYYILSEDKQYSREVDRNILYAQTNLNEIEKLLTNESKSLSPEFLALKVSVQKKIEFNERFLDGYLENGLKNIKPFIDRSQGVKLNDDLVKSSEAFLISENINVPEVIEEAVSQQKQLLVIDNITYLLGIGMLAFALIYLLKSFRTRMKLQGNLVKAKEEVEKSSQIKEQFMANMSHEIRTPLQTILGYSNYLNKEKLSDRQVQYVDNIQLAGENLLTIVNDILDVSKIESGMMRLEKVPFSISGLMHSLDNLFHSKATEKNIYLNIHPNASAPDLLIGDPVRLTQIMINLIANAIKFTEKGGIDIYREVSDNMNGKLLLKFSVKDSGIGIPKEKIHHIFDRFEQADSKVTRLYGGSGLGLYIVKQLIDLQNGKIELTSELGKGSLFSFEIVYGIASDELNHAEKKSTMVNLKESFQGLRILLVEDNLMNQRMLGMFLTEWGMDFDLSENGKVAIEKLESEAYDLILMDIQMPEMDGYSTTEYIRQNMEIQTPIIAMTAHAFAGEREKALSYGMNEYISKPVKAEDLYKMIARFVPLQRLAKSSAFSDKISENKNPDIKELRIDYNFLMDSSKGKKKYLKGIFELFIQQVPQEFHNMEEAFLTDRLEEVAKIAHSLKSTAGYAGMDTSFRPLLESIEKEVKEKSKTDKLKHLIQQLKSLISQAIHKIKAEAMPLVETR